MKDPSNSFGKPKSCVCPAKYKEHDTFGYFVDL